MFPSAARHFQDIFCPRLSDGTPCALEFCIFSHKTAYKRRSVPTKENGVGSKLQATVEEVAGSGGSDVKKPIGVDSVVGDSSSSSRAAPVPTQVKRARVRKEDSVSSRQAIPAVEPQTPVLRTLLPGPASIPDRREKLNLVWSFLKENQYEKPASTAEQAELDVAKRSTKATYQQNVRRLISEIRRKTFKKSDGSDSSAVTSASDDLFTKLEALVIPETDLARARFVLRPVEPRPLDSRSNIECVRCNTRFQLSEQVSRKMDCRFHWARPFYDHAKGQRCTSYPCCSQPVEDAVPCERHDYHVLKLETAESLAGVVPYTETPLPSKASAKPRLRAVALDCEMGYTTFGMELIRLTVLDWDTGRVVLDRAVHPYGKVVDLNTRFSGISTLEEGSFVDANGANQPIASLNEVRQLLFELVDSDTIIVGHGLENDFNALRIIHRRVADTAILYANPGSRRTFSLKFLCFKYLGKDIQTGEHDSTEDARTAMDIIKINIKRAASLPLQSGVSRGA